MQHYGKLQDNNDNFHRVFFNKIIISKMIKIDKIFEIKETN